MLLPLKKRPVVITRRERRAPALRKPDVSTGAEIAIGPYYSTFPLTKSLFHASLCVDSPSKFNWAASHRRPFYCREGV